MSAQAATMTLDLSGAASWDGYGDPSNNVFFMNIGANSTVTGVEWNIDLRTVGASWLQEAIIDFDNSTSSSSDWFALNPGFGLANSGNQVFNSGGMILLANADDQVLFTNGGNLTVGNDGLLKVELFETFDDVADAIDANYGQGSYVTIQYEPIPEPATMAVLGLGAAALLRRKRK
ncbi:PEP-CTERM sorting domain-containing protein [Geitlerinema splendidum]|nr:PEP-CTERM sorting domain-containing protein [Geitlerinema splendidum]